MTGSVNFSNENYVLDAGGLRQAHFGDFHMPIIEWGAKIGNTSKKLLMLTNIDQYIFAFVYVGTA
jgi:hypothetical protein